MNLADKLARTAEAYPEKVAVRLDDDALQYRDLADGAARVTTWLNSLGVQPGERVGIMLPNLPQFPIIYYGILWAGGVVVPMNPLFKSQEIAFTLKDSEAKVLFAWDGVATEAGKGASDAGATFISVGAATFGAQVAEHPPAALTAREAQATAVVLYTSEGHRVHNVASCNRSTTPGQDVAPDKSRQAFPRPTSRPDQTSPGVRAGRRSLVGGV
jgi:long-chain acyl-CoA synthetase